MAQGDEGTSTGVQILCPRWDNLNVVFHRGACVMIFEQFIKNLIHFNDISSDFTLLEFHSAGGWITTTILI